MQTILVVAQSKEADLLQAALQQSPPDWQVETVTAGTIATTRLAETKYDILVLAQQLADMPGLALWAQLQEAGTNVASVFVGEEETAVSQALAAGIHSYVLGDPTRRYLAYLPQVVLNAHRQWLHTQPPQVATSPLPTRLSESGGSILADVLNMASEAVIMINRQMQIIFFNEGAVELFAYPVSEVLGQPLSLLLPSRFRAFHDQYVDDFVADEETARPMSQRCRVYARRRDGSEFRADASIVKLSRNGQIVLAAILRDVTEHESAAESLNQYAKRLEALHEMDQAILAARSPQEVATAALSYLRPLVPYQRASILTFHPQTGAVKLLAVAAGAKTAVSTTIDPVIQRVWQHLTQSAAALAGNRSQLDLLEEALRAEGLHAYVIVPLIVQNQLRGVLSLDAEEESVFDQEHMSIVHEVATPVAMAIQQAQLLETERSQRELAETLRQIAAVLNGSLDREQVLRIILEQLARVIPYDSATVMLADGDVVEVVARRDEGQKRASSQLRFETLPHIRYLLESARPVIIADTAVDDRWQSQPDTEYIRCWLGVPLIVKNLVIGLLNLNKKQPGYYTQHDANVAVAFADQAALAVENAQLYTRATHEIDERKQAEAALQAERALLAQRVEERTAELTAANARLARAVRARDEFLASMTHELRTPLNAVLGMTEIMRTELYGPLSDKQQDLLLTITESGYRLLDLINDILDVVRIEAGQLNLDLFPVAVTGVCTQSVDLVRSLAQKKHIELKLEIAESLPQIWADELRLQQILVNLLNNAIKFTMSGHEVGLSVRADAAEEVIYFTVWDNGIGISLDDIRRLFSGANGPTPFIQLDSGLNRHYEGTGLGLSLIYRLTELHGGSVRIRSEVGQGSRFTIALPRRRIDDQGAEFVGGEETAVSPYPDGPAVLLAEDNATYIRALSACLSTRGYRLLLAHNGHEAVRQARKTHPDLIVMDLQMPELGGKQAVQLLREDASLQDVPIVAITGLVLPGDRDYCLAHGVAAYLPKPILLPELMETVETLVSKPWKTSED